MASKMKAMVINEKDNVATALTPLEAGSRVSVKVKGHAESVSLLNPIPAGHKFALREIGLGEEVFKYGEPIGRTTAQIARGQHVHVHNVVSDRRKAGV